MLPKAKQENKDRKGKSECRVTLIFLELYSNFPSILKEKGHNNLGSMMVGFDLLSPEMLSFDYFHVLYRQENICCLTCRQMALQMIHFCLPDMADVYQQGHKQTFTQVHPHMHQHTCPDTYNEPLEE